MKLIIGYLYPDLMNIYGDTGNIIALTKRAQWRGIEIVVKNFSIGGKMSKGDCDIFFFGGGQDQAQVEVARDLLSEKGRAVKSAKGKVIRTDVERGVPLLAICGGYQLLGEYYKPAKGPKLPGVGLFPAYTVAGDKRMIGNIVIQPQKVGPLRSDLVGFENHSGKTYLKNGGKPLGTVKSGYGNNGEDGTEGIIYKNAIGCYMHGSLLPKNPELADWLIHKALEVKYGKPIEQEVTLKPLDDTMENEAHKAAIQKFS